MALHRSGAAAAAVIAPAVLLVVLGCSSGADEESGAGGTVSVEALAKARTSHTTTLLPDGRVLVIGGTGRNDRKIATAEVWSTDRESFGPAGSLAKARTGHTATALPDGRVLVVGGWSGGGPHALAEIWRPGRRSFAKAGSLSAARNGHTATILRDGRVLVVGGGNSRDRALDSAEVWDPRTSSFQRAGSLARARRDHTATLLPDGRVLITGGHGRGDGLIRKAELWDPATDRFGPAGSMAHARAGNTVTLLADGRVLIVGGSVPEMNPFMAEETFLVAEVWDPIRARFSRAGSLSEARTGHTATLLPDDRVLIVGGDDENGFDLGEILIGPRSGKEAEIWDPATSSFDRAGRLSQTRRGHSATLLPDGRVFVVGGCCGPDSDEEPAAEVWDPGANDFVAVESFGPVGWDHTLTALPDGRVMVIGGGHAYDDVTSRVGIWAPAASTAPLDLIALEPRTSREAIRPTSR